MRSSAELDKARALVAEDPGILSGTPVIRNTRIPVYDVAASVAAGLPMDRILAAYPGLTVEMVRLATLYARATHHRAGSADGSLSLRSSDRLRPRTPRRNELVKLIVDDVSASALTTNRHLCTWSTSNAHGSNQKSRNQETFRHIEPSVLEVEPQSQLSGAISRVLCSLCGVQHSERRGIADIRGPRSKVRMVQHVRKVASKRSLTSSRIAIDFAGPALTAIVPVPSKTPYSDQCIGNLRCNLP